MASSIGTIIGTTTGSEWRYDSDPTITVTWVYTNRIFAPSTELAPGMVIFFADSIGGLTANAPYYILTSTDTDFTVSETLGGPVVTLSDSSTVTNFVAIDVENLTNPSGVINAEPGTYFQIDYGDFAERIALSLETIAANSNNLVSTMSTIESHLSNISEKQTSIEEHQQLLKELASGDGLHIVNAYDIINMISTYRYLIEGGGILQEISSNNLSPEQQAKQIDKLEKRLADYINRVKKLPKSF